MAIARADGADGAIRRTGASRAAGLASHGSASPAAGWPASGAGIDAIVYDPRYSAARDLAQRHATRGVRLFETNDCIVRLWRGPLSREPGSASTRIAGFTPYSDFAMARDCARDRGLRVIHEEWCRAPPVTLVLWLMGLS